MKSPKHLLLIISLITINACQQQAPIENKTEENIEQQNPLTSVKEARRFVQENFDDQEETLWISDKLNDNVGMNMAIIGDGILKAGYTPDGFEQKEGYRIYKYKKED